ncbi:unnamed protein product [Effrenium voratum]|nr:unnamed protein product [Effrenium voratum]
MEEQAAELWARQEDLAGELQDLARSCEQQQHVGSVGERTLRLALKAQKAMNAAPHDAQLRQESWGSSARTSRSSGSEWRATRWASTASRRRWARSARSMSLLKGKRVASSVTQPKPSSPKAGEEPGGRSP